MLRAYPGAGVDVGYGVFVGLANRFAGVAVTTGVAVGVGISVGTIAGVAVAAGAVVGAGVGVGEGVAVGSVAGAWVGVAWTVWKLAITVLSASMVKEQVPVPEQSPDQLVKVYPELAVAVTATSVPGG